MPGVRSIRQQSSTGLPMAHRKRVHILSTVNAANVSKSGGTYTIREVCGAVDDLVMNGMMYPADQLATAAPGLSGKPAPAGHPKNAAGQFISAVNGEALQSAYIGSICLNGRHEGGRTLVDVVVNAAQAKASEAGAALLERLDAAIAGTNIEPIHVSTGLFCEVINAKGESRGKKYERIATNIAYDHLAILLNEKGAGTPGDGVGMFLNAAGQEEPVEAVRASAEPEDKRAAGWKAWLQRLIGNGSDISFDQITSGLYPLVPEGAWLREVFDRYAVWCDKDGRCWKQDYTVSSAGSVAFVGSAVEVTRKVTYEPLTTNREESDAMKDFILNALKAAGIVVDGKTDEQLMRDYDALKARPLQEQITAANSKVAEFEAEAKKAEETEKTALATELAVNSALTADDFKAMPLARLRELKAKAAPVLPGAGGGPGKSQFAAYDPNEFLQKQAA